jgi:isopentenyl-diphosphate delta-isomerase
MLLQRRSAVKEAFPNRWTASASGHVDEGETWEKAAYREMMEEIGIRTQLKLIGDSKISIDSGNDKIRQFIRIYEGLVDSETQFELDENEVSEIKWYDTAELKLEINQDPDDFTPSFRELVKTLVL